ncbi:hypothetical protein PSENEW3_00000568 [Picochlorum sp. SENEW3]|nr:hypothetical protein PSENEW3_00000568 [Picochlorum sp. SENEW3]
MYGSAAYLRPPSVSGQSQSSLQRGSREPALRGKFTPKSFKYNGRVAAVLLTSLLVLVGYGGPAVAGVLITGSMLAYVMDAMRYKEGSFLAVWMSLALSNLAMGYSTLFLDNEYSIMVAVLGLLISSGVLFLTGCWATLQFKWIQLQYPAVVVAFEKMLLTSCLPTAGAVMYLGLIVHNGIATAPYITALILCGMYALFARPLSSSFYISPHSVSTGGAPAHLGSVQKPLDGLLSFFFALSMPAFVYVAAHNAVIMSWTHLWAVLLLVFGPILFMSSIPQGLWWMGDGPVANAMRRILVLVSLAGALSGVEGRIVFHSFGQYLKLAPPWSYIAITVATYGFGAVVLLLLSGMMGEETAAVILGPVVMISTAIGSLVLGLPIWALPAPLIGAAGVALYFESRALRDYGLVVIGGLCTCAWFLWQHFWFLDIKLDGMSLKVICSLIFAAMIPAVVVPGLLMAKLPGSGPLLVMQAVILAILEEHLSAGDYEELTYNVHPMFPASLVIATTVIGIILARKMGEANRISNATAFVLECIYGAKISMLFVPESRMAIPVVGYALACLHPLFLGPKKGDARAATTLEPWKGLGMAFCVILAVAAARFAIFDALHIVLDRKPSEALAAGSLLLAIAVGLLPMINAYYAQYEGPRRAAVLIGSFGLLLILLRPPLPIKGGAECPKLPLALCPRLWDASHTPRREQDDVAVYGDGLRRREHWPLWLVVVASFFGVLAATSKISKSVSFAPFRLIQAGLSGLLIGGYMALEFFPGMQVLQATIVASSLLVAFMIVLLSVPSRGSAILLPLLCICWFGSFPGSLFVLSVSRLPPLPQDMVRLHPDIAEGIALDSLRWQTIRTYLIACFAAEALILSFAAKLRLGVSKGRAAAASSSMLGMASDAMYIDKAAEFLGGYVPSAVNEATVGSLAGKHHQKLTNIGMSYLPEACNILTVFCFSACLWVSNALGGEHASLMVPILCSILLLLSQDSFLLRGLADKRRYFPPYAAACGILTITAIGAVIREAFSIDEGISLDIDVATLVFNVGAILLCLPSLLETLDYLWTQRQQKFWTPILTGILATSGVFISEIDAVKVLCGLSGISAILMSASAQHSKDFIQRVL